MNSLFGLELPAPVNFIVAFIVVLALIGAATWAVKRFGSARMEAASRGRLPRLAVVDSAAVDGRRKLVIVRRDNVEHLLMIGGPTDVVVETAIVRGTAAAPVREPALRAAQGDTLPRVVPLPDPTPWPLAPEPAVAPSPAPAVRAEPPVERIARPVEMDEPQWPEPPAPLAVPVPPPARPAARDVEPPMAAGDLSYARPEPAAPRAPIAAGRSPATVEAPAAGDANLVEMAQRLEAALRRPAPPEAAMPAPAPHAPTPRRVEPKLTPQPPRPQPRPAAPAAAPARPAAAPPVPPPAAAREPTDSEAAAQAQAQAQTRAEFENLEQEMASLLGRPSTGKT